jgi:predicted lysophospholipase L1 biosynthesis ABC-type transport system permease subunit
MRAAHAHVGGYVAVSAVGVPSVTARVVGEAIIAAVGHTGNMGEGSYVSTAAMGRVFPPESDRLNDLVVTFKPGVNVTAARARLSRIEGDLTFGAYAADRPVDLVNFGRTRSLPWILSGMLALLAIATLIHALVANIRRRRRDLAILKTVGFSRGQVASSIAWQASIMVVMAVAIGIPVGVIVGRLLWNAYATSLGVLPEPRVPLPAMLGVLPAAALIGNLASAVPARFAARTRPGLVLRTE